MADKVLLEDVMQTITIDVRDIPDQDLLFLASAVRIVKRSGNGIDAERVAAVGNDAVESWKARMQLIDAAFDNDIKPLFVEDSLLGCGE